MIFHHELLASFWNAFSLVVTDDVFEDRHNNDLMKFEWIVVSFL